MNLNQPIWIGAHNDVRTDAAAEEALAKVNDSKHMTPTGIISVPQERWKAAQKFELDLWNHLAYARSDRSNEHLINFGHYESLPQNLGSVIEVGCGPFTQLATILANSHSADSITLSDPLTSEYKKHPGCAYPNDELDRRPVRVLDKALEDLNFKSEFDTLVCINVLEHVRDATKAMHNMTTSIKAGGHIIFHERSWDTDPTILYDVGHPIRLKSAVIEKFLLDFTPIYVRSTNIDWCKIILLHWAQEINLILE